MENIKNLKGIIFDYGGTIDSRGVHWSEIIYDGYKASGLEVEKNVFRDVYVEAERELARHRHILPHHNFYDLLLIKMRLELGYLVDRNKLELSKVEPLAERIALYCYE
ncbi:MAG: HAD family hydrolase, partial [Duncaniella sp.]|nr:HAD family hydrolase [Duncaniella sp.]